MWGPIWIRLRLGILVHEIRDVFEVFGVQVPIAVECDGCCFVAEHPLNDLYVPVARYGDAGCRVSKVIHSESLELGMAIDEQRHSRQPCVSTEV